MKISVSWNENGIGQSAEVDIPDECTTCGRLIVFPFNGGALNLITGELETLHNCTNTTCNAHMICYHSRINSGDGWTFKKSEPPPLSEMKLPDFVREISSTFFSIFREAVEAKDRGLSQIAGPGYRKAFEFLIKDYAKSKAEPSQYSVIENTAAGQVVTDYITDTRVQAVARRALWIGNDETHYLRKWEARDINDLVTLIKLTIEWIDIERQSAAYLDEMPDPVKPNS